MPKKLTEEQRKEKVYEAQQNALKKEVALYQDGKKKAGDLLDLYRGQIEAALPSFLTPDRLIRVALTAMARTPALLECTQHSIISAVLTCAQLGLMPDSIIGEAYLVPFKNNKKGTKECQIIVGYRGLITLVMRSNQVKSIQAFPVYGAGDPDGDEFSYDMGLNEKLEHKPSGLNDPARLTHYYAILRRLNGGHSFIVLTQQQVLNTRNEANSWKFAEDRDKTAWATHPAEMGCKTAIRKLLKTEPMSVEVNRALGLEDLAERGESQKNSLEFLDNFTDTDFIDDISHEVVEEAIEEKQKVDVKKAAATTRGKKAADGTVNAIKKRQTIKKTV